MADAGAERPVEARAVIIEPATGDVVWSNAPGWSSGSGAPALRLADALELAEVLGVPDAIAQVARTGEPRHVSAGLVSTSRGTLKVVASVYRLPDASVLIIAEKAWETQGPSDRAGESRPRRRR